MHLYQDHLYKDSGVMHVRTHQLKAQDKRPEYVDLRVIPSESQDHAYLVGTIEVLNVPFDEADVAEDRVNMHLCSCDDFYYNRSNGIENREKMPSEVGQCKHILSAYRAEKAKADESQTTL